MDHDRVGLAPGRARDDDDERARGRCGRRDPARLLHLPPVRLGVGEVDRRRAAQGRSLAARLGRALHADGDAARVPGPLGEPRGGPEVVEAEALDGDALDQRVASRPGAGAGDAGRAGRRGAPAL